MFRGLRFFSRQFSQVTESKKLDFSLLLSTVSDLTNFGIKLRSFPTIVAVGPQSFGKSSLVETLCNANILPKKMGLGTMKPTLIYTRKSEKLMFIVNGKVFQNEDDARNEVERINVNPTFKTIQIEVESPHVYNCSMYDMPGLFVVADPRNPELPKQVKELTIEQLKDPNIIPLLLHSGASDIATNSAMNLVIKYGRTDDAIGVITKLDITKKQNNELIRDMIDGKSYPLGHGYIGVILRNDKDIENHVGFDEKRKYEQKFFETMRLPKTHGVDALMKKIAEIQYLKFKDKIPELLRDIDIELKKLESSSKLIGGIAKGDNAKVAEKLKDIIEKLIGSSLERVSFEAQLKTHFIDIIRSKVNLNFPVISYKDLLSNNVPRHIARYLYSERVSAKMIEDNTFHELFSYGMLSPIPVSNDTLQKIFKNESILGAVMSTIEFTSDDPLGRKRLLWNKNLERSINDLLTNDNVLTAIYEMTKNKLLEYVLNDIHNELQNEGMNNDDMKKFASTIIEEISKDAFESDIKFSMKAMIKIGKRPNVSSLEIVRNIAKLYPEHFNYDSSPIILPQRKKLCVEVYGELWNQIYMMAHLDRTISNTHDNVYVNLFDRIIVKLLERVMDMFNKESASKMQMLVDNKRRKLLKCKEEIANYR